MTSYMKIRKNAVKKLVTDLLGYRQQSIINKSLIKEFIQRMEIGILNVLNYYQSILFVCYLVHYVIIM